MKIEIIPVDREQILPFRDLYRQELNCQIVHDSAHYRENCTLHHQFRIDGEVAGHGATWVGGFWMPKGSLFEFYLLPAYRCALFPVFEELLRATLPPRIYAQTNDPFLGTVIFDYVEKTIVGHILFADRKTTHHAPGDVLFRHAEPEDKDRIFPHLVEPVGDWLLEIEGQIVASGGIGYHYNRPYGDIFMEVHEPFRRRGLGSFLVQELKKVCSSAGSIPAARCKPGNIASRRTLERAGLAPCGRLIYGDVVPKAL